MNLGCVLMAAGSASRYGANKLLERVDGVPLYERAMAALGGGVFRQIAVVSRYEPILSCARGAGLLAIPNPGAGEGVAASIRLGVAALKECDGLAFAVCDQPWLTRGSVARLAAAFQKEPELIWALGWQGRKGNPVFFPRALFPELAALTGDTGGSAVIRRHPHLLRLVEAGHPRELADLDYPIKGELP